MSRISADSKTVLMVETRRDRHAVQVPCQPARHDGENPQDDQADLAVFESGNRREWREVRYGVHWMTLRATTGIRVGQGTQPRFRLAM